MTVRRPRTASVASLPQEQLDTVAALLAQARSALFITGSGMSSDSGLPHYRGLPGLERKAKDDGKLFEAVLSIETLQRKPGATWRLLLEMEARVRAARPNQGHEILVELERDLALRPGGRSTVMTINVDRLHQRAGSRNVIEMHGALYDLLCSRCELSTRHERFDRLAVPPLCPTCGTVLRPDMPMFGEALPADPFTRLQAELDAGFDLVVVIGVGTMFPYLARPVLVAKADGVPTVEIGAHATDVSDLVDHRFHGSPRRVLELIADGYRQMSKR